MKKSKIYALGVFYQTKILGVSHGKAMEFSFSDARYFRDCFSKIVAKAREIDEDRKKIIAIEDEKKRNEELEKLFNETVKSIKLDKNLVEKLDKAGVKLTISELSLFE